MSRWHDFAEELPSEGRPILCKGKKGAYYVGKPVTINGEVTDSVYVPKGGQYWRPAKWMEIDDDWG